MPYYTASVSALYGSIAAHPISICAWGLGAYLIFANVVGYANRELIKGSQGAGVSFIAMGKKGTMADLKVTGYGKKYEDQHITAVKLDTYGRDSGKAMYWVDYSEDGVTWYGWYDSGWETDLNDTPLAPGEGVWFKSPSADIKIVSSGQVNSDEIPVVLIKGSQLCPNPTPVELKMNAAYISGYEGSYEDQHVVAVKLDTYGCDSGKAMYWVDYSEDGVTWYGWYDSGWENELGEKVTLTPGESVWLKCPQDGWMLNWPSPLKADK